MIVRLVRPTAPADGPWLLLASAQEMSALITPTPDLERLMPESAAWFEAEPFDGGWTIKGRVAGERRRRELPRSGGLRRAVMSSLRLGWRPMDDCA